MNGIVSAASPHSFLGINGQGRSAIVRTRGNRYGHIVLRGGGGRPNYDTVSIALAEEALAKAKLPRNVVVDCSHANSRKKADLQPLVLRDVVHQIREGTARSSGSCWRASSSREPAHRRISQLRYGCSVTDACIGWDLTAGSCPGPTTCCATCCPGAAPVTATRTS